MADEMSTKPTIETVLERINEFDKRSESRSDQFEARFDRLDARFDHLDTRFDNLEARFDNLEAQFDPLEARFDRLEARFDQLEAEITARFEQVYIEIDRVASVAHTTKGEMLGLRVEFRELRTQLKDVLPIPQAS